MMRAITALLFAALAVSGTPARAEEAYAATITIRDHRFEPAELRVPAGKRIALTVINTDPLSEEFDSTALKVEKVFAGKSQGVVHISPLNPGTYESSPNSARRPRWAGAGRIRDALKVIHVESRLFKSRVKEPGLVKDVVAAVRP